MDNYITVELHNEFAKRMEDEHARQNHRIADLEKFSEQNNQLLVTINKLATSMENMQKELQNNQLLISVNILASSMETMQKELTKQGGRLEVLESRDGNKWRQLVSHGLTVLVTVLVTYALRQIGIV